MKLGRMRFGPLHFLLLLILLLAGGLAWMWLDKTGHIRNVTWVAPKALLPDIKTLHSPPPASTTENNPVLFAVILERPVFAPDRRPPPAPAPPAPPDPLANIQIHGIFSGANAGILARVDGKVRRVKLNETVGSWTLKSIDGRDVTFTQGDENRQLRLAYARLDTVTQPTTAGTAPASNAPPPGPLTVSKSIQDETREYQRRRNEARAARGLPPVAE